MGTIDREMELRAAERYAKATTQPRSIHHYQLT